MRGYRLLEPRQSLWRERRECLVEVFCRKDMSKAPLPEEQRASVGTCWQMRCIDAELLPLWESLRLCLGQRLYRSLRKLSQPLDIVAAPGTCLDVAFRRKLRERRLDRDEGAAEHLGEPPLRGQPLFRDKLSCHDCIADLAVEILRTPKRAAPCEID